MLNFIFIIMFSFFSSLKEVMPMIVPYLNRRKGKKGGVKSGYAAIKRGLLFLNGGP